MRARARPQELDLRNQRLKRAMDLSMKHTYLPADAQALQTPYAFYLTPALREVEGERAERAALGAGQPCACRAVWMWWMCARVCLCVY